MSKQSPRENNGHAANSHSILGKIVVASHVGTAVYTPTRIRNIILLLAASVALMMTGFGIIMPVFARRLGEFGNGVEALGLMTMSFALAQLIASPFMGSFADKYGRRPLILLSLAAFFATNIGYLLAQSTAAFIAVRTMGGLLTAGLFPAAMGVVSDIVPEKNRAQWVGIVMGGYGVGFIFGPVLGGVLYDSWGFVAPFATSAVMAALALIAASILVPETLTRRMRHRIMLRQRRETAVSDAPATSYLDTLPRPLTLLGTLLFVDFIGSFAFAYVEPQMVFYLYEELGWSTAQFGMVVGAYGLAMVFGQTVLGRTSDRYGRKPVILIGILLNSLLYIGMAIVVSFQMMMLFAVAAGLGSALIAPALSALYLDITAVQFRSRVVGIKESALALGGVVGPLLVVIATRLLSPKGIFLSAGVMVILSFVLALAFIRKSDAQQTESSDLGWQVSDKRCMAAQATLRGVVMNAARSREMETAVTHPS
ncbi:MAG: MFS transporter [Chloroflexi bacterium]|nr:MFS transporter [Chloroflexota bacterium]